MHEQPAEGSRHTEFSATDMERPLRFAAPLGIVQTFLAIALATSTADASAIWHEIAPPPVVTAGFARGARASGPFVTGGNWWDGNQKLTIAETWHRHDVDGVWHPSPRLPKPFAFGAHGMVGDIMFLAGGDDGTTTRDELIALDQNGKGTVLTHLPQPVAYSSGAILQNRLYILGGSADASGPLAMHDRFLQINLADGSVHELARFPGGPIIHAALVAVDDALYAFTGGQAAGKPPRMVNLSSAWRFDPAAGTWTRLPDYPFPVRGLTALALDGRRILLAGGYRSPTSNNGSPTVTDASFVFDSITNTYHPALPLPYAAMLVGLIVHDGWIYVLGGETAPRQRAPRAYRAPMAALLGPDPLDPSHVTHTP